MAGGGIATCRKANTEQKAKCNSFPFQTYLDVLAGHFLPIVDMYSIGMFFFYFLYFLHFFNFLYISFEMRWIFITMGAHLCLFVFTLSHCCRHSYNTAGIKGTKNNHHPRTLSMPPRTGLEEIGKSRQPQKLIFSIRS